MQFHLGSRDFLPLYVAVKCGSIPRHGGQLIIHCLIIVPAGPCNQRETRNKSVSADEYYITAHDVWFLPALSAILSLPTTLWFATCSTTEYNRHEISNLNSLRVILNRPTQLNMFSC